MKKIFVLTVFVLAIAAGGYFAYQKWVHPQEKTGQSPSAGEIEYYQCGMHPQIIRDQPGKCPICGMTLTPVYKNNGAAMDGIVRIDPAMVQNIGVKTEVVMKRKLSHTIRTTGRIEYDETKQTVITTKFSGYIEKLYVDFTGLQVQKGQPLFEIYSPELVATQQEYLQAIRYSNTMKAAGDSGIPGSTDDLLQSARKKLSFLDISPAQVTALEKSGEVQKTLTVYSPFSGIITEKNIFDGMQIQAGMDLLKLADMSGMWVIADIYENELSRVKTGAEATIDLPFDAGKSLQGKVSYIYPYLNDQSRTAKVRIKFSNEKQLLKKDMYVTVNIVPVAPVSMVAVPVQSVIHSGVRDVVVLALGDGKFRSADVKLGSLEDGYYEVISGVNEGDTIVTSSQFLIDSESNLNAGLGGNPMPGMDMGKEKIGGENREKGNNGNPDTTMGNMKM